MNENIFAGSTVSKSYFNEMAFEADVIVGMEVQVVLVSFFVYVFHVCFVIVKLYTSRLSFTYHTFNFYVDKICWAVYITIYI